ncbi:MAG: hypothetical protein RJB62_627, partial [Pseudomonadota bacterium]
MNRAMRIETDFENVDGPIDGAKVKIRHKARTDKRMNKPEHKLQPVPDSEAEMPEEVEMLAEPEAAAKPEAPAEGDASVETQRSGGAEMSIDPMHLRIAEALLFAAPEPLAPAALAAALPAGTDVPALLAE